MIHYEKKHTEAFSNIENIPSELLFHGSHSNNISISFVIPTANRSETLLEAVKSIVDQKCNISYELLIVDNSADRSSANYNINRLRENVGDCFDYYLNSCNIGMVGNFNKCFLLAKSEWVAMLHDDDIVSSTYFDVVENCLKSMESYKKHIGILKISARGFSTIDDIKDDEHIKSYKMRRITKAASLFNGIGPTNSPTCGILIKKNVFLEIGGFDQNYYPSMDHLFGYMAQRLGYRVLCTRDILGYYRNSISESRKIDTIKAFIKQDYRIRNIMYLENKITYLFGIVFEPALYQRSIDYMISRKSSLGQNELKISDIDFKNNYRKVYIRSFLLECLQKFEYQRSKIRGFK